MTAILVKCLPATNTKPARFKAVAPFAGDKDRAFTWSKEAAEKAAIGFLLPTDQMSLAELTARELCRAYGWKGALKGGNLGENFVFVFLK